MQQKSVEIELQCQRPEQQIKQDKKKNKKTKSSGLKLNSWRATALQFSSNSHRLGRF